jgi:ribose 5-phosphate isomerase A
MTADARKQAAAEKAMTYIQSGMTLGLGTGSTAAKLVDLLGAAVADGMKVVCVPTSEATRRQAEGVGIPLATLDDQPFLDLTIDGADELDADLRLIKGGGGALLREKIVAMASDRMIVIADDSKQVETLGAFPLPIEVIPFGLKATVNMIDVLSRDVGCSGELAVRIGSDGKPFVTDSGNLIVDCKFGRIPDPESLDDALKLIPGVVENGLFLGVADVAIIAGEGGVTVIEGEPIDDEAAVPS